MGDHGFRTLTLPQLRTRRSFKWTAHPPDVLPAFVAESDFSLAPPIARALLSAVERGDTGYPSGVGLAQAFVGFAARRFGWAVDPQAVRPVADVMSAVGALLEALSERGEAIVVNPPIYPPFRTVPPELGRTLLDAPLAQTPQGFELDLDALESSFAGGARIYLLCHPHNPTGRSFPRADLIAVAELATRYGVIVIADEVHAPLALSGCEHVPFLTVSDQARACGIAVTSASKAWNLAGLKCALIVTGSPQIDARLAQTLSPRLRFHLGHLGELAAIAAFEEGEPWLDAQLAQLDRNRRALVDLLADALPAVGYQPPQAGYLAWLDFRSLGLGDDPAAALLDRGRVALSPGSEFGDAGKGWARLNFATSSELVAEIVGRIATGVAAAGGAQRA